MKKPLTNKSTFKTRCLSCAPISICHFFRAFFFVPHSSPLSFFRSLASLPFFGREKNKITWPCRRRTESGLLLGTRRSRGKRGRSSTHSPDGWQRFSFSPSRVKMACGQEFSSHDNISLAYAAYVFAFFSPSYPWRMMGVNVLFPSNIAECVHFPPAAL